MYGYVHTQKELFIQSSIFPSHNHAHITSQTSIHANASPVIDVEGYSYYKATAGYIYLATKFHYNT